MKKIICFASLCTIGTASAQTGKVGVNTTTPTEIFDANGTARVRELPANGTANAIYNGAATKATTFTATRTVVADANGVLGTVAGLPSNGGSNLRVVDAMGPDFVFSPTDSTIMYVGTGNPQVALPDAALNVNRILTICSGNSRGSSTITISPVSSVQFTGNTTGVSWGGSKCLRVQAGPDGVGSSTYTWWVIGSYK